MLTANRPANRLITAWHETTKVNSAAVVFLMQDRQLLKVLLSEKRGLFPARRSSLLSFT